MTCPVVSVVEVPLPEMTINKFWLKHGHGIGILVKPTHVVTSIKQSPFSCPVVDNFIWIEPLLRGHLSNKATFLCLKGVLLIQV